MRDYDGLNERLLSNAFDLVSIWLPNGKLNGAEYTAINPTRNDTSIGSFKINLRNGKWSDFATDERGVNLISLYAYIFSVQNSQAYDVLSNEYQKDFYTLDRPVNNQISNDEYTLMPLPDITPLQEHYQLGKPTSIYCYENFYIYRFDTQHGKEIRPLTYRRHNITSQCQWRWKGVESNRPLFNKELLENLPVLVVEGEKAASIKVLGYTVVTWAGGSNAVNKTDWTPLLNRQVIVWPDRDEAGKKAAEDIVKILPHADVIPIEYKINDGLDLADVNDPYEFISLIDIIKENTETISGLPQYWFDPISSRYFFDGNSYKKEAFTQIYLSYYHRKPNFTQIPLLFTEFNPQKNVKYFHDGKPYCNTYRQSNLSLVPGSFQNIQKLIMHLVQDENMYKLFINWLATFYQTKDKSKTAWVFQGDQGAGKGILFTIITQIFGEENCETVTDHQLESRFNSWMIDKLFINFNEVSTASYAARQKVKNIIKTLVTDDFFMSEKKGIDEIKRRNWANIMISSNEVLPLDVEVGDRRFNIVNTGGNISKESWFDYERTLSEVPAFAYFLKHYTVNNSDYNKVVENDAKKLITQQSDSIEHAFCKALCSKDIDWFTDAGIVDEKDRLFATLCQAFEKGRVGNSFIRLLFHRCHPSSKMNPHQIGHRLAVYFKKYGATKVGPTNFQHIDYLNTIQEKKEKGYQLP